MDMTFYCFYCILFKEKETEDSHIVMCTNIMNHNSFLSFEVTMGINNVPIVNLQIKVVLGINMGNQHNLTMLYCDGHKQTMRTL